MADKLIWEMPVSSTALLESPTLGVGPSRVVVLEVEAEDDSSSRMLCVYFEGMEAYKVTFGTSCSVEVIESSYDRLVELPESEWLAETRRVRAKTSARAADLRHFHMYFDDGPAYEVIARNADVEDSSK